MTPIFLIAGSPDVGKTTGHDYLKEQGWIVVDSTGQSVEETVAEILERTGANQQ